jgi:hypothetical protein
MLTGNKEIIAAVTIGIGLAASCGFRIFVPMLVASIAAKTGVFPVQEGFEWLAAVGTSILSLIIPIFITIAIIGLIIFLIVKFRKKLFRARSITRN